LGHSGVEGLETDEEAGAVKVKEDVCAKATLERAPKVKREYGVIMIPREG